MRPTGRLSGILLPLFSFRTREDFGIGDFGALEGFFDWMDAARQRMLMLLPLLPTAPGDPSPYATRSAFGLNPLFIHLPSVPEFEESGGFQAFSDEERRKLEEAQSAPRVRYDLVFPLKRAAALRAFARFEEAHWREDTSRAREFKKWRAAQEGWLESYALYASLSAELHHRPWWEWPAPLRDRAPIALREAGERLSREILFREWEQWVAETQWQTVRRSATQRRILLCGDEPFIVGMDSADCWTNPHILRREARLGVPPDAFSATGQDWGLPYFDFAEMQKEDYAWLRFRARNAASYYDVRRVDHAVGYFRQWIRDAKTPNGRFVPPEEPEQRRLGEVHFRILSQDAGIVAEDLGVIPDWVRETLSGLGLPGYRVLRWERDDQTHTYRNPRAFPNTSLVTTGTHDTETLREWWESNEAREREAVARAYPEFQNVEPTPDFTPRIHEAFVAACENAGSDLAVLPWQDVLGTSDRINLPGTMGDANWAYRINHLTNELLLASDTRRAASFLAHLTEAGRR
jgi:4-alpha-glucanotransferase